MPIFIWSAETRKGETKKGELDGADEAAIRAQLRRQGYKSIGVKKKPKDLLEYLPFLQQKVSEKDVVIFARIFATMINAGLPLIQCLDLLGKQEQNKTFAKVIGAIKEDIEGGSTLTDALRKYPKIFDNLFVNLVAAGESGGILDVILQRLSGYMEKAMKLKSTVKGAMTYPIIVGVIAVVIIGGLLIFVVPMFQKMFEGMGGSLPAPTQFLVDLSQFLQDYYLYMGAFMVALYFGFKRFYATEKGTLVVDALVLKAPIFGPLLKKVAVAKFTRTLSTMMQSGVPILEGLGIVSKTSGNKIIEIALMKTRQSISEGKTIAEPLMETDIFPAMVVQMIAVGEATGALDTMLAKIADFYDDEVDAAVGALTAMLEPLLMCVLGPAVGFVLIAMYLPIFQAAAAAG
ncbi:MAG: type II secretion system F family protein [Proteobacteria bacterium]|nr:type II secretion system F family protein [Pseudomonadota bacterium]MBU4073992.1 type II secretion system F family protein [Pseudomonadota bacterium]